MEMKIPPRPMVDTRETIRGPLPCHATSMPFGKPKRVYRRLRDTSVINSILPLGPAPGLERCGRLVQADKSGPGE